LFTGRLCRKHLIHYDGTVHAERDEQSPNPNFVVGSRGPYQWVTSDQHFIDDIVRLCPEVLLGRYLAVTSTDSGEPKWWAEKLPGWESLGRVGYSPCLESTEGISYQIHGRENAGFDEWYTFETRSDLGEVIVDENPWTEESRSRPGRIVALVNHYFSPDLPDDVRSSVFWDQLKRIHPESYISDGAECVTFVSRNAYLFQSVCASFALAMPTTNSKNPTA
jgi:hypothetical protein